MMTPLFASIQFGRNRSPLQEKSIIAMMFENTLRCTGRSLFMQLPIFPLLTAVRRRANEYCALTLNIFFSSDMERVTFFQHLAQINDRGVMLQSNREFCACYEVFKNYIQSVPAKSGQFQTNNAIVDIFFHQHYHTRSGGPTFFIQREHHRSRLAQCFQNRHLLDDRSHPISTTASIALLNFTRGHTFTD